MDENRNFTKEKSTMSTKIERVTRGRETPDWGDGHFSLDHVLHRFKAGTALSAGVWIMFSIYSFALTWILIQVNRVLRWVFPAKDAAHSVNVMKVLCRHKTDDMRLPATTDFHAIHSRWTTPEELMDDNWMLYGLNHNSVTFVRMPKDESNYQAKQAPFLYITQQQYAEHVATMSIETFLQLGKDVGKPEDKVFLISNSGRAGTTLLAQLLQIDGVTMSFSEPDIFFSLGAAIQDKTFGSTIGDYVPLLRAVLNVLCKNQPSGITYVFKSRCFCNALLPVIPVALPEVKHMFLYREDTNAGCRSMVKSFKTRLILHAQYEWKAIGVPALDRLWFSGSSLEKVPLRGVKPRTIWEYGATVFSAQYSYMLDYVAKDDSVMKMTYESMIANTESELVRIYNLMDWPQEHIPTSLECMKMDSQAKSPLSRAQLARHTATVMPLTKERAAEMAYVLRLPKDFFQPEFRFDHTKDYER